MKVTAAARYYYFRRYCLKLKLMLSLFHILEYLDMLYLLLDAEQHYLGYDRSRYRLIHKELDEHGQASLLLLQQCYPRPVKRKDE